MSVIEVQNLHKRYGETVAVDDVSFSVEAGEIFGILGRNGAGKTTTVEIVEGLRRADAGTVSVLGLDPVADASELRRRLGAQLQEAGLPPKLRVGEAMELFASFHPAPADGAALLERLGIAGARRTQFARLSGGQKQRLSIALALIGRPEVVILDELTSGLDVQGRRDTWRLVEEIRDGGTTVVLVTHFMDEAERLCDRVALIDAGRVIAVDEPGDLADRAVSEQVLRFKPRGDLDERVLLELPEVSAVRRTGERVLVTGTGDVVSAVTAALARRDVAAEHLRVEAHGLEDAFVALTGARADDEED